MISLGTHVNHCFFSINLLLLLLELHPSEILRFEVFTQTIFYFRSTYQEEKLMMEIGIMDIQFSLLTLLEVVSLFWDKINLQNTGSSKNYFRTVEWVKKQIAAIGTIHMV